MVDLPLYVYSGVVGIHNHAMGHAIFLCMGDGSFATTPTIHVRVLVCVLCNVSFAVGDVSC